MNLKYLKKKMENRNKCFQTLMTAHKSILISETSAYNCRTNQSTPAQSMHAF